MQFVAAWRWNLMGNHGKIAKNRDYQQVMIVKKQLAKNLFWGASGRFEVVFSIVGGLRLESGKKQADESEQDDTFFHGMIHFFDWIHWTRQGWKSIRFSIIPCEYDEDPHYAHPQPFPKKSGCN